MRITPKPFLAENLSAAGIRHGFFGRKGGVSEGIYASLNCGYGSEDLSQNIDENRARVAGFFEIAPSQLVNPYQIHSNKCEYISAPSQSPPKADAFVTDVPGLLLGILTADCAPILFYDPIARIVGAAHAGWQGAISGIIEATNGKMCEIGSRRENIIATIGPCIGKASYEVSEEYFEKFIAEAHDNTAFFTPNPNIIGKYFFDLKTYCASRIKNSGIKNIEILPHDTCALEDDFFSNRRRNKCGEPDYGRNISTIMLD